MAGSTLLSRRGLLLAGATAAGGALIAVPLFNLWPDEAANAPAPTRAASSAPVGLYVRIDIDGRIVIGAPSTEMGQGINTAMPMMIAEEMDADWSKVSVEQMPLMIVPNPEGEGWIFRHYPAGAGGSSSIIDAWPLLRPAGAKVRAMLIAAAAARWNVAAAECTTEPNVVIHAKTGRRLGYGEIAAEAATQAEPADEAVTLKERAAYRIVGTPVRNAQAEAIVTGAERFGIDVEIPGMLYASIERAPSLDARVAALDDTAALAVPGVRAVVRLDGPPDSEPLVTLGSGVAVVAESYWAALKGRRALVVGWTETPWANESTESLFAEMGTLLQGKGQIVNNEGDFDAAIASAAKVVDRTYDLPYVSHATLEPQTATAHVRADACEVWASTQAPGASSRYTAEITGLTRDKITINPMRMGGGFGRRLEADYVAEAVTISKAVGAPVKVIWTREDDLRHDYYRPAGRHQIVIGMDEGGRVTAFKHRLAGTTKSYRRRGQTDPTTYWMPDLYDADFPMQLVPHYQREYFAATSGVPRRSWRAPGHTANAFAIQSALDEAAFEVGKDPLAFRLELLGEEMRDLTYGEGFVVNPGRLSRVLKVAAQNAGWGEALPPGRGRGIAGHYTFSSYCAHVVDVTVDAGGRLSVDRVVSAIDCGYAVNPLGVRAQVEGGVCDALSTALGQQITIRNGAVVESNFDTYHMMRMDGSPRIIDVHIVEDDFPPTGVGEPPVPPLAPALTNAIFAATGKRIRRLPIGDQLTLPA